MPIFPLFWLNSWFSYFLISSQGLLKVPDYISTALPAKVISVVDSAKKIPTPLVVPGQARSHILPNQSTTPLASFSFLPLWKSKEYAANTDKPLEQTSSAPNTLENVLCAPIATQNKQESQPVAPTLQSEYVLWLEASTPNNSPKLSLAQKAFRVVQSLFQWPKRVEASINNRNRISVVVVRDRDYKPAKEDLPKSEWYQLWVKEQLIARIPDKKQAKLLATRLVNYLENPNLKPSELQPLLVKGKPAGKMGTRLLFAIDDKLARKLDRDREVIAIEWVNNLRIALNAQPLTLVQAQSQMHGLVNTDKKITGLASWYGGFFHGRLTANGERYNQYGLTAAHKSLPFNTFLKVKNLKTGDETIVRINDRGPYIPPRSLDLSLGAARCVDSEATGVVPYEAVFMQKLATASR